MKRWTLGVGAALAAWAATYAMQPQPEVGAPGRTMALTDAAFLAGAWKGSMDGDAVEEHWTAPDAGGILGMFRWTHADGSIAVMEILSITKEGPDVLLRLRHLDAQLNPWASEKTPMTLRLTEAAPGRVVFRGVEGEKALASVTYESPTPDRLKITVEFVGAGREPLRFDLARAAPAAK